MSVSAMEYGMKLSLSININGSVSNSIFKALSKISIGQVGQ